MSFRELDKASHAFAAWLQKSAGLQRGDRVAQMMPNLLQYPVALFGVLRAGMVVVNVNPLYTPRELRHQFKDADVRAIVVIENFAHTLEKVIGETALRTVVTTAVGDLLPTPKRLVTNAVVKHVKKTGGGEALEATRRRAAGGGLRPHRNLAGGDRQPGHDSGIEWSVYNPLHRRVRRSPIPAHRSVLGMHHRTLAHGARMVGRIKSAHTPGGAIDLDLVL